MSEIFVIDLLKIVIIELLFPLILNSWGLIFGLIFFRKLSGI